MKETIFGKLSPSMKFWLKRMVFAALGSALRLRARAYDLAGRIGESAIANGLDISRAWDIKATPQAKGVEPWGASDFLFLMRAGQKRAEPDTDRSVRTSVIITVFNNVERTFQCLRSLLREIDDDETEIIVVNNASTDETREVLTHFAQFVRIVDNDANRGFADACNQGAAAARGRYLVFLRDDAVVLSGWLGNLVETVERDASAGAVGSLALCTGGRVREAGAIVWSNGELFRYGSGRSADDRRFAFAREVDCCTGASLLVRKDLFDRLGGFDGCFDAARYADADLCMGVRSDGFKVVYQPLSRIISYEGATALDETRARVEQLEAASRETFRDKWREALEREHHAPDPSSAERAANRKWATQVAVFDDLIPTPDRDAGSARMMFILRALSEWSHPVFITTGKRLWPEYEKLLWREGIETASALDFKRLLRHRNFRAVVLSRPAVAELLMGPVRRADPKLKIVYDMLDVHHLRSAREAALTGDERAARESETLRRLETRLARAADLIWCGSAPDKVVMERLAPGIPSVVIPTLHKLHARGLPFDERKHLLFVGNFRHRPNVDAVHYLAREIMPLVRQSMAGVELLVVGDKAPPEFAGYASEGVRLLGYVPDLDPIMAGCRVFVAPIRFGSGVNGKIGEAISYGLPVVTTTIGAEGWGFDGGQVLIADAPREFADAVLRLYGDAALCQRLSDSGYRHIAASFTPEVVGRVINDSLKGIAPREERAHLNATVL